MHAQLRIVGIQNQRPAPIERTGNDELGFGQSIQIINAVFAEMIIADVGDDRGVGMIDGQAAAQQATTCRLEYGCFDLGMAQYRPRAGRSGVVAGVECPTLEEDAVRAPEGRAQTVSFQHRRKQAHRRGLAVRTGDEGDRDRIQRTPWHRVDRGQCRQRPAHRALAEAKAEFLVIEYGRDTAHARSIEQSCQHRFAFSRCVPPQHLRGGLAVAGRGMPRREQFSLAACGLPRPFIDFGGAEQLVDRRGKRQCHATAMRANADRRSGPAKRAAHAQDVVAPCGDHARIVAAGADRLQHCTGFGEIQVGSGQSARVLKGQGGLRAQSSCSRDRWMPRSSRTTPSHSLGTKAAST
jgi:hypothetical protein